MNDKVKRWQLGRKCTYLPDLTLIIKLTHLNNFYAQFYPQFTKIIIKYLFFRSNCREYFDWFAPQGAETFDTRLNTMDSQVSNVKKKKNKIKSQLKQIFIYLLSRKIKYFLMILLIFDLK